MDERFPVLDLDADSCNNVHRSNRYGRAVDLYEASLLT